jgi:hypothetical protein
MEENKQIVFDASKIQIQPITLMEKHKDNQNCTTTTTNKKRY